MKSALPDWFTPKYVPLTLPPEIAVPSCNSELFAELGVPVAANAVVLLVPVTVPLKLGLLTIAIVGVEPLKAAIFEPAESSDERFWNVGVPEPAEVRI